MKNQNIVEYLEYFIGLENPQYAVLLRGKWGCGKTFFIKKCIAKWTKSDISVDDNLFYKPIYISLNGISKIETINKKIKTSIHPILYSKGVKVAKKVITGLLKTCVNINFNSDKDNDSDGSFEFNLDSLSFLLENNNEIKGKKILIFDDVERCKISIDELFGYFNNFVEHSNCKVILIGDEERIKPEENIHSVSSKFPLIEIKEKLIGQSFEIESDIEDAINHFIKETEKVNKNIDLNEYKVLIIDLFNISEINNLRILKQSLYDLCRFSTFRDPLLKRRDNFNEFERNLTSYFILTYLEFKSGKIELSYFQNPYVNNISINTGKTEFDKKYELFIIEKKLSKSNNVIQVSYILDFIKYGKFDFNYFNNQLQYNIFFRNNELAPWEKLWNWYSLSDYEFKINLKILWSQLYKTKFEDLGILFHVAGIIIDLVDREIVKIDKSIIEAKTKANINKIFKIAAVSNISLPNLFNEAAYGKGYLAYKSHEFIELYQYYLSKVQNHQKTEKSLYLKSVFYNIDSSNIDLIYEKIGNVLPDHSTTYLNSPMLSLISGKKVGKNILKLDSGTINQFRSFLIYRFSPENNYVNASLQDYHLKEKDFLIELNNFLKENLPKRKILKKYAIQLVISYLENVIQKINDKLDQLTSDNNILANN